MRRGALALMAFGVTSAVGCGSGGGATTPQNPTPSPVASDASAAFTLSGAFNRTYRLSDGGGNLVFCRPAPRFWIRLAEQRAGNGENGPHVDIDVCNYSGNSSGRFTGMDPSLPCTQAATWDIYWHEGPGLVFSNQPTSSACELNLSSSGATLTGSFACRGLVERGGSRTLDVVDGTFRCTVGS